MLFKELLELLDEAQVMDIYGSRYELAHHVRAESITDDYLLNRVVEKMFTMDSEHENNYILIVELITTDVKLSQVLYIIRDDEFIEIYKWCKDGNRRIFYGLKRAAELNTAVNNMLNRRVDRVQEWQDYDGEMKLTIDVV